jgi:hypothetical protein
MLHSSIDADVRVWAEKHSLRVNYGFASREVWGTYLSSVAGDCFQIWVEPTPNDRIGVHNWVDGPNELAPKPTREWVVEESDLQDALEQAYEQVINWMAPSARYSHV